MKRTRKLAVSFVLTVATLPACESTPPLATAPVGGGSSAPDPATSSPPIASTTPPAPSSTPSAPASSPSPDATTTLPPAPTGSGWTVAPNADGTCTAYAIVHCPIGKNGRPIACNPPPPHKVKCPGDAGP